MQRARCPATMALALLRYILRGAAALPGRQTRSCAVSLSSVAWGSVLVLLWRGACCAFAAVCHCPVACCGRCFVFDGLPVAVWVPMQCIAHSGWLPSRLYCSGGSAYCGGGPPSVAIRCTLVCACVFATPSVARCAAKRLQGRLAPPRPHTRQRHSLQAGKHTWTASAPARFSVPDATHDALVCVFVRVE